MKWLQQLAASVVRGRSLCSSLGSGVGSVAEQAAFFADQVLVVDKPELAQYDPEVWASAVAQIAQQGEAHTVLIGGSRSGREYSPRVAVKLDAH